MFHVVWIQRQDLESNLRKKQFSLGEIIEKVKDLIVSLI